MSTPSYERAVEAVAEIVAENINSDPDYDENDIGEVADLALAAYMETVRDKWYGAIEDGIAQAKAEINQGDTYDDGYQAAVKQWQDPRVSVTPRGRNWQRGFDAGRLDAANGSIE